MCAGQSAEFSPIGLRPDSNLLRPCVAAQTLNPYKFNTLCAGHLPLENEP